MTALLIPCNCECHNDECHADHGFNGAYRSYCSGCETIAEYQAECGCCLNADGGPVDGPAAIHKWVAILPEVGGDLEIDALVQLACDASRMVKRSKPGAVGALTLVNERLDALGVAA